MFRLAAMFLLFALATAIFGYGGAASAYLDGARLFSFIFLGLAAICFVNGWLNRPAAA